MLVLAVVLFLAGALLLVAALIGLVKPSLVWFPARTNPFFIYFGLALLCFIGLTKVMPELTVAQQTTLGIKAKGR